MLVILRGPCTANTTLYVLVGNIRGGEPTWQSLYKNALDYNSADLALMVGESKNKTSSLYTRAAYVWETPEYADWGDALDHISAGNQAWRSTVKTYKNNLFGGVQGHNRGGCAITMALKHSLQHNIIHNGLLRQYTRFVITRADQFYLCKHTLQSFNSKSIEIPHGEDYGGVCDRSYTISHRWVLSSLSVIDRFIQNPSLLKPHPNMNCERAFKLHLNVSGIRIQRVPRVMFTAAVPGDPTRWSRGRQKVAEGVLLKYPHEYTLATKTCKPVCKDAQAIVGSQGGVGSTAFFKIIESYKLTTNHPNDADGIKHLFPSAFTFDGKVTATSKTACLRVNKVLIIVGEITHATVSTHRRFGVRHINKLRSQLGWPLLTDKRANALRGFLVAESGMAQYQRAWLNVSSPRVRVMATQDVYANTTALMNWLTTK